MSQPLPPGAFARALKDKREGQRRRRLWTAGIAGGLVLTIGVLIYLFWFSPVFATREVEVTGVKLLTADEVRTAADVELGVPVLRQDGDAIAERVRTLPEVRDVSVVTALPGSVIVNVEERTLLYQLVGSGSVQWVDAEGVVFGSSPQASDGVIQVSSSDPNDRLRADIATVVTHLPDAVRGDVVEFTAPSVDRISFKLTDGRQVIWGSAEESELKSEVLAALLSVEASVYDVSAPRSPITKK